MSKPANEKISEKPIKFSQKEKQQLAVDNLSLVMIVARRFQNNGLDWDDLVAYGNIGLVHAANKFDPNRGFKFSSYAVRCIQGEICRGLDSNSGAHVPVNKARKARDLLKRYYKLEEQLGHNPTIEELATKTRMSRKKVQDLLQAAKAKYLQSLDAPITKDGLSLGTLIPSELPTPDIEATSHDATIKRRQAISRACEKKMSNRDGEILAMSFGVGDYDEDGSTLKNIGEQFGGLSRERVRQIILQACKKLKKDSELRQTYEEALAA